MDEGRKRVLLIAASILAARKLAQYGGKRIPATVAAISDAVRWAKQSCGKLIHAGPLENGGRQVAGLLWFLADPQDVCNHAPRINCAMEAQWGRAGTGKNVSFRYQVMSVRHHTHFRKSYKEVVRIIYRRKVI
jgi:hypothetical protein